MAKLVFAGTIPPFIFCKYLGSIEYTDKSISIKKVVSNTWAFSITSSTIIGIANWTGIINSEHNPSVNL